MSEPLVFLPGMMCDARVFGPQLAEMSAEYSITVASMTMGDRVEEIASGLLDTLPRKFALVGLSFGGVIAMELLRRAPGRISRIAFISTNALAETPQSAADFEPKIITARSSTIEDMVDAFLPPEAVPQGPYREEIMHLVLDMAENVGTEAVIRQARALQRRRDQQATLRKCKVPALVLCGELDGLVPVKRNSFLAELIPYAELNVIEGVGHLPTLEAPEETTRALFSWLKQPLVLRIRADA